MSSKICACRDCAHASRHVLRKTKKKIKRRPLETAVREEFSERSVDLDKVKHAYQSASPQGRRRFDQALAEKPASEESESGNGAIIFGSIGSGRTVGIGLTLARAYLASEFCGLFLKRQCDEYVSKWGLNAARRSEKPLDK